jgi:predicted membrane protein
MSTTRIDILMTVIAIALIVLLVFVIKGKEPQKKKFSIIGFFASAFIVSGIVFANNRTIGYILIGIGIALSMLEIIKKRMANLKNRQF